MDEGHAATSKSGWRHAASASAGQQNSSAGPCSRGLVGRGVSPCRALTLISLRNLPIRAQLPYDLTSVLNKKIRVVGQNDSALRIVESISLYGTRVSADRRLDAILFDVPSCSPRLMATMRIHTNTLRGTSIEVTVETLTGNKIKISCASTDTVACVKLQVQDAEDIPLAHQRLLFQNEQLEDDRTLESYKIQNSATVFLVVKMHGGCTPRRVFADVSDDSLLVAKEFGSSSPDWLVATEGLNIEGRCKNRACVAYKEMVVHPKLFNSFNLLQDDSVPCPICRSEVKPLTCGFYDCMWKFEGTRSSDGLFISSPWREASGGKYHEFDADETHGCVEWSSLLIVAKPLSSKAKIATTSSRISKEDMCATCWTKLGSTSGKLVLVGRCGHSFHRGCVQKWTKWCNQHNALPTCPVCLKAL